MRYFNVLFTTVNSIYDYYKKKFKEIFNCHGFFSIVLIPCVPGDGWCNLEGGISRETRPSSSSLSESEMTSGGLGTRTPAALPC